jgi:hypothetical protein
MNKESFCRSHSGGGTSYCDPVDSAEVTIFFLWKKSTPSLSNFIILFLNTYIFKIFDLDLFILNL